MEGRELGTGRAGKGSVCGGRRRSGGGSGVAGCPVLGGSSPLPDHNRVRGVYRTVSSEVWSLWESKVKS